eukprot:344495_1
MKFIKQRTKFLLCYSVVIWKQRDYTEIETGFGDIGTGYGAIETGFGDIGTGCGAIETGCGDIEEGTREGIETAKGERTYKGEARKQKVDEKKIYRGKYDKEKKL